MTVRRPALRWHGGKWRLAPWIIQHFPPHRIYVEPYGGAGSVLLRKPRAYAEVYNDMDSEVVGLFEVLRSPAQAARLTELLRLTPFARAEFEAAYAETDDPIERARRLVVRSYMGFGSDGHNKLVKTGFRANTTRAYSTPARNWADFPDAVAAITERLNGCVIERRPALDVMRHHDGLGTLHYVDPPYLPEVRSSKSRRSKLKYHAYTHEMTRDDHVAMLDALQHLVGFVVVSGYPSALYDDALAGWSRVEIEALADGAKPRTEVLWLNPAAAQALRPAQGKLEVAA